MADSNSFYRKHYHHVLLALIIIIVAAIIAICIAFYQIIERPLPGFRATTTNGKVMNLVSHEEPNMLPDTILRFASKGATIAYTFNYVNWKDQLNSAKPYFTANGWISYVRSIEKLLESVTQNQLFVNGVVAGTPIISNQGALPGQGYTWRVQIPFLVAYTSANTVSTQRYYVILTIVKVPTSENPQGIGIDQFIMV